MWVIPEMRGSCLLCGYNRRLPKPNTGNCEHTTELHHCVYLTFHTQTYKNTHTHMHAERKEIWTSEKRILWGSALTRKSSAEGTTDYWRDREDNEEIFHFNGALLAYLSAWSVLTSATKNPPFSFHRPPVFPLNLRPHPCFLLFVEHLTLIVRGAALVNRS